MANKISMGLRLKQITAYVLRSAKRYLGFNKTVYVSQRVSEYRGYWENAAKDLSAEFISILDDFWEIRHDGRSFKFANDIVPINNPMVFYMTSDKGLCYKFANERGLAIPQYKIFQLGQMNEAKKYIAQLGGDFVVKPIRNTSSGIGVSTHVRTKKELERSMVLASVFCDDILVERMIPVESCKLLFLDAEYIHGVRRRGVRVTGDGKSSIRQLMEEQGLGNLPFDRNIEQTLHFQGLSIESVVENGQETVIRALPADESSLAELRTVYDETITDLVCPALIKEAKKIIQATESNFASVDIMTNNPEISLKESGGVFLEINPQPGIHHHYNTEADHQNSVATKILDYLIRDTNTEFRLTDYMDTTTITLHDKVQA